LNRAKITYGGGESVIVECNVASDLVKDLGDPESPRLLGTYLNVRRTDGESIWINPAAVASVEHWPDADTA
jgi:hypothetical protein